MGNVMRASPMAIRRSIAALLVAASIGSVMYLGRWRVFTVGPDGATTIRINRFTGSWRLTTPGNESTFGHVGCLESGWIRWLSPRHVVVVDMQHELPRHRYGVWDLDGVRIELCRRPTSSGSRSSSGHAVTVWEYFDLARTHSAFLEVKGELNRTVIGEGPWTIDACWTGPEDLRLTVRVGVDPNARMPEKPPDRVGPVSIEYVVRREAQTEHK